MKFKKTMKKLLLFIFCLRVFISESFAQQDNWTYFVDSVSNLSSARAHDLNGDGIKDIVFGSGTDGVFSNNGIVALNGANGQLLWKRPARNEVFGSAIFKDLNNDAIADVLIAGRQAQLLAINGSNGQLLWDYFPYGTNPADSGLYNFYNPQFVPDQNNDGFEDILVSNGGDHAAPVWVTNRPPGYLMLINSLTGEQISMAVVPDSAEIYCSPIVSDLQNNGQLWVLYGTGGETLPGNFYACPLSSLAAGNIANSVVLASDNNLGFIAPAAVCNGPTGSKKIFIQSYSGTITCVDGATMSTLWSHTQPGTESSSHLTLGNFTGNAEIDAFAVLYKGIAPSFTDYYQLMLDGETGNVVFMDSIGSIQFAAANAFDYNNDGRDEALISTNDNGNGYFQNKHFIIDFQNDTVFQFGSSITGANIASTPLIDDLNNDGILELIFLTKKDSLNPSAWKGVRAFSRNLNVGMPNSGIAWGSYMGSEFDGAYQFLPTDCGVAGVSQGAATIAPTCNGFANGSITPIVSAINGPHTFLWNNGSTDTTLTNLTAGTYTVRIVNAQNCYEDVTYNLFDPYEITFGGIAAPTCPGGLNGMATLNSTGCQCMFSTCTFLWENGITVKPNFDLPEGWSSVVIYHPDGCVVVDSVFVPFSEPGLDTILVSPVSCFGDSTGAINLIANPNFTPVTFSWFNGTQDSFLDSLPSGNFLVEMLDSRGCSDSLVVNVPQNNPLAFSGVSTNVSCYGDSTGIIDLSIVGGTEPYSIWINNQPYTNSLNEFSIGTYNVSLIDSLGCLSGDTTFTISQPNQITVNYIISPEPIPNTNSGIITATVQGGTAPFTFLWSDPNNQTDSVAVYLNTGWYALQLTDGNGCTFNDSVFVGFLGITEQGNLKSISIYPNPAREKIFFNQKVESVQLYNSLGAKLSQEFNVTNLNIQNLDAGTYFIEINNKESVTRFQVVKAD
jgi:hypothetical protein